MLRLLVLVFPLSLDTFASSAAFDMLRMPRRTRLRLSLILASFEAAMSLTGLAVGAALGASSVYIASAALVAIGAFLILSDDDETHSVARLVTFVGRRCSRSTPLLALTSSRSGAAPDSSTCQSPGRSRCSRCRHSSQRESDWHSASGSASASVKRQSASLGAALVVLELIFLVQAVA